MAYGMRETTQVAETMAVSLGKKRPLKRVKKAKPVRFSSVFWCTRWAQLIASHERARSASILSYRSGSQRYLLEEVGLAVLFGHSPVGVEVRVGDLGSFARATDLDTHEEGDPDGRDDTRNYIAVAYGQEETLDSGGLGSEKVVECRDGGGESGECDAFRHDG